MSIADDIAAAAASSAASASSSAASAASAHIAMQAALGEGVFPVIESSIDYPTRALFVAANGETAGVGLLDGQIARAAGLQYRRSVAAAAISDLPGWVPNGDVVPEHFGAVGDGVADDTAALQAALDAGFPLVKGTPGAIYRIATTVYCPSSIAIDLNGARFRRGGTSQWMFETVNARTTWDAHDITLRNWWCDDDGTLATRGNFNLLVGDRIKVYGYKLVAAAPYDGTQGAWSMYVSGDDIELHDLDIDTEAATLWSDGIHVGHVRRLLIGAHTIRAGDDAIAFYPAPRTYTWCGRNLPSENITVMPGFVSSLDANGLRIGAQQYINATETASPSDVVWNNLNIVCETIGDCNVGITLSDKRTTSDIGSEKHTGINIKVVLANQTSAIRVCRADGNPDVMDAANRAQHNFNLVKLEISGNQRTETGGTPGELFSGGGIDRLEIRGDLQVYTTAPVAWTHCTFQQIEGLYLYNIVGRTSTTASFISCAYVRRIFLNNPNFTNDGNQEFAAINLPLNADQDVSLYVVGGRINDTARPITISGTGAMKDFHLVGTQLAGTSVINPPLGSVTSWTAGGTVIFEPAGGYSSGVLALYGAGVPIVEGHRAYATNGRKAAEGAGLGTGQMVYRNGTAWLRVRDDSAVTA